MSISRVILGLAALLGSGLVQAQGQEGKKVAGHAAILGVKYPETSREPVTIAADVKEVEEGSLPMDLQTSEATRKAGMEQYGKYSVIQSRTQDLGLRIFAFTLAPKERISLSMKSSIGDSLWMNLLKPSTNGIMRDKIQVIEQKQKKLKLYKLGLQNELYEPFTLGTRVMGPN